MLRSKRILIAALLALVSISIISALCREMPGNPSSGCISTGTVYAQDVKSPVAQNTADPSPAESSNAIYIVMSVVLIVWIGLAIFIFYLDRKVTRIEKNLNN